MAATFFMVSGGTYGTEEVAFHGAGYGHGILILLFLPVLWCLPTAFMIGELLARCPLKVGITPGCGAVWGISGAFQDGLAVFGSEHL